MLEVTVAAAAVGLLAVALMQATIAMERGRRATERIDYASRELDNLLERFVHKPFDSITPATAANIEIPEEVTQHLPAAELETLVIEEISPIAAKRVAMKLRWRSATGQLNKPLTLTAWVFHPQEQSP